MIQCWEAQRIANFDMYINSIKETLPYLFAFNRYNYQQSALEFLADISLLGDYYTDLLRSGIMFESLASQPGKQMSCGYVLEIYNKIIKQITPNIDSTGSAWLRNLPRLAFIRQILLNAAKAKVFSESENDPISRKLVNIENIAKIRWVLERRNIFDIDNMEFSINPKDAFHTFNGLQIERRFIECKSIGKLALDQLVSKVVEHRPKGSIEYLRKQLKILPFKTKTKCKAMSKPPLSKAEKQTLLVNYKEDEIPKTSYSMVSPDNGCTPYMGSKKSESGKFILDNYAEEINPSNQVFDLIVVDFMALIFSQPPSHVYTAKFPLEAFCSWLVTTFLAPYLEGSPKVVICIDRKDLDKEFPLKCETHKKRKLNKNGLDFVKLLSILLNSAVEVVSDSYIPPFSWISSNRDIRFELIFKAFEEIFQHPDRYPFPNIDFEMYVDGFYNEGKDLHAKILNRVRGHFLVTTSDFTVTLPEADQSIFHLLKCINFNNCLVKYRDNDILLSALMNFKQICSATQTLHLQNLSSTKIMYNISQIYNSISEDSNLSHVNHPVQSLVFSFLSIGNNDYSGRIWGMSCGTAYQALQKMGKDLAYIIDQDNNAQIHSCPDHLNFSLESECYYSISLPSFKEFITLLYIERNLNLFKGVLQSPLPKNIQTWKKSELTAAFDFLDISKTEEGGKLMTIPKMKAKLLNQLELNLQDKQRLETYTSQGKKPSELEYSFVQTTIWLNKNPKDWCPSEYQIHNIFGRCVLTILLFSTPACFPPKVDLVKFGYNVEKEIALNLAPSQGKEKNVALLLSSICRKLSRTAINENKRKPDSEKKLKNAKKRKANSPEKLID